MSRKKSQTGESIKSRYVSSKRRKAKRIRMTETFYYKRYRELKDNNMIEKVIPEYEKLIKQEKRLKRSGKKKFTDRQAKWILKQMRKVNRGHKSHITKLIGQRDRHPYTSFIPIKREKGESKTRYNKRLRTIKRQWTQESGLSGVYLNVPADNIKGSYFDGLTFVTGTNKVQGFDNKYVFVPIDDKEAYLKNPKRFLQQLKLKYNPRYVYPMYGSGSTPGGRDFRRGNEAIESLIDDMTLTRNQYSVTHINKNTGKETDPFDVEEFLTGFMLQISERE